MAGPVTVVGLGPAGPELVTPQTLDVIGRHPCPVLRTDRHPAATVLAGAPTFDDVYESAATFADTYAEIARRVLAMAADGPVLYAVPGSPLVLERTVELVRAGAIEQGVDVELLAAMSFLDVAWARLGIDPVDAGVRLVDGHRFATAAAGQTGPLLVAHCHARYVLSDIKLAVDEPPESVVVLQRLGLPDESIREVAWADLDREVEADHLTSLFVPELAEPVGAEFVRFDELVRVLRDECPWDREQTHGSLRRHLLEEAHETLEALDARAGLDDAVLDADLDDHLAEELGDLLYQIFFHARLAAERGSFTAADVVRGVHDKLVIRHPHVFGATDGERVAAADSATALGTWEAIKREEKGRDSAMDGLPPALPGLLLALKVQKRAASTGFDRAAGIDAALADVESEMAEVRDDPSEHEVGDLLFAGVQVALRLDIDPEAAVRAAARRFEARFREVERAAAADGVDLATAEEATLAALWTRAKTVAG